MLVRAFRRVQDVVRFARDANDPGFALIRCIAPPSAADRRAFESDLTNLGFVIVDGSRLPAPPVVRGRHVAVLCTEAGDSVGTAPWIRRVGLASCRSHLLVLMGPGTAPPPFSVREVPPAYAAGRWTPGVPRAWRRARQAARQGRRLAAVRWLRAAVAEAHRGRDRRVAALASGLLVRRVIALGDWERAWRTAHAVARRTSFVQTDDPTERRASALALHVGRLTEAEALARAAVAAAVAAGALAPAWSIRRLAEIRLVQGRLEEATTILDEAVDASSLDRVWKALASWLSADAGRWPVSGLELPEPGSPDPMACAAALLQCGAVPDGEVPGAVVRRLIEASARRPRWVLRARGLPAAAAARVLDESGWCEAAGSLRRTLAGVDRSPMQRRVGGPMPCRPVRLHLPARLCTRTGIVARVMEGGVTYLGGAVAALVERVAEAEDEAAVLAAACRWATRQPGVIGAALVGPHGEWLHGDRLTRRDVDGAVLERVRHISSPTLTVVNDGAVALAPVRYAGAAVGAMLVRAATGAPATAREAAAVAAPVCGPAMRARLDALAELAHRADVLPELIGSSPAMVGVRHAVARAAATTFAVLVEGESGTGKELVARGLHRLSPRRDRAFCPVNCAAFTDELAEAELFGHARGAFTGAVGPRAGLFEEAHLGTLFMDEVSELSARAQAKLLRALQEGEVRRLGENAPRQVNVRVIAATNRPLADAVAAGRFRDDLMFRLAVARVRLPPLRDRLEDLPELARRFWTRAGLETGTRARLAPDALARLAQHPWPGNVRELQNVMAALVLVAPARGFVGARLVDQVLGPQANTGAEAARVPLRQARRAAERRRVVEALARHGGRRTAAARELGLTRQGLAKAVRRLGLARAGRSSGVA